MNYGHIAHELICSLNAYYPRVMTEKDKEDKAKVVKVLKQCSESAARKAAEYVFNNPLFEKLLDREVIDEAVQFAIGKGGKEDEC